MESTKTKRHPLKTLADIYPGYPFRSTLPIDPVGDALVVQQRHIVAGERLSDPAGDVLSRVRLPGQRTPDYLRAGDLLFLAKGSRNDAVVVGDVPGNTVCTPNFYHIRLRPQVDDLLPAFLAWQLNHLDAQRYFSVCAQGSAARSITKTQLGELPVMIPPIAGQKSMIHLVEAAARETRLLNELIDNRQRQLNGVGQRILHPEQASGKRHE